MRRVDAVALAERLRTEESLLDYSELPTLPGTMAGHSTSTRREDPSHTHTQVNTETHPRRKTQKHTHTYTNTHKHTQTQQALG